jgi:hypothetical protein
MTRYYLEESTKDLLYSSLRDMVQNNVLSLDFENEIYTFNKNSMIYTIGHRDNYADAIREYGAITKLPGGYAFQNMEDAERMISELGESAEGFSVYGIKAYWNIDTKPIRRDGWWHILVSEVSIVSLD